VGFNLSPVLWRKLPGAKSAGRVQSVCLRLIVEREMEIEAFRAQEYWTVAAKLATPRGQEYDARLTVLGGKKLDKFDIPTTEAAELAVQAVTSRDLKVASVEAKPATRNPSAPFMTSTLQQEASRKFGMGARQTMSAAQRLYERTSVVFASADGQVGLRATGQVVVFDGFLKVYEEGRDDDGDDDANRLPQITEGEAADKRAITPEQHFTQPPPRYTEATLVKRMEELGIGRPSTYASIITTIQDRDYVRKEKNRLIPEDKGRLVTVFLTNYFRRYVEYDFTADLEAQLDDISAGQRDYKEVLARFWRDFSAAIAETADLRIGEVLDKIDEVLSPHLYPPREDGSDPRICPLCGAGRLHLKTARSGGAFIGCGSYPECRYTRPISSAGDDEASAMDGKVLGKDEAGDEIGRV
jgi:DNA topoisomerase IA